VTLSPTITPTVTPTIVPTGTPTGTVTGSPTATPTATPSPTGTPTATPTATPPPGLTGEFAFLDRQGPVLSEDNQSFFEIGAGQLCFAGLVRSRDPGPEPQPLVTFEYRSDGTIEKANEKKVKGDFISVLLTLTIERNGMPPFERSATSRCELKANVLKAGEKGKARLKCDLGEQFSELDLDEPENADFLDNVQGAFPRRRGPKHVKLDTLKGKFRVTHNGQPDVTNLVDVGCSVSD